MLGCMGIGRKKCYKLPQLDGGINIPKPVVVSPAPVVYTPPEINNTEDEEEDELPPDQIDAKVELRRRSGVRAQRVVLTEDLKPFDTYPKNPDEEALIKKALQENDFVRNILEGDRMQNVIEAMYSRDVQEKDMIIRQNEPGSHLYVSEKGSYEVIKDGKVVNIFHDKRVFGEIAILYDAKRNASIRATTAGRLWVLDQAVFRHLVLSSNIREQNETLSFLLNVEELNTVGEETLNYVANLLQKEFFTTGTEIVREGDEGDKFYIIRAGSVTISKKVEGIVGTYTRGQYFGERALLSEDCRQATVVANPPGVECLTLGRVQFTEHFGNVVGLDQIHTHKKQKISQVITSEFNDVELSDLEIHKTLGVGGFGRVELVTHKTNSQQTFALKYLKKVEMIQQQQQEHAYNEKALQMACNSMYIVRLYKTYQDNKYLYFLMETCLGGDLFGLLHKQPTRYFSENDARFFSACVLEALAYLHERGIIYRDLKPENVMIDTQGYLKLTDFGFAKRLDSKGKTYTFAGTPEYVAPEIVLNRGHDKSIDYWAFGVFVYELLVGKSPFNSNDRSHMQTYNHILRGIDSVVFPTRVTRSAQHFIKKLCRAIPTERLGCAKNGIQDVRDHKWFMGFDFNKLHQRKLKAPFVPKLKSQVDTRYFDHFKKDGDIPPDDTSEFFENF